MQDRIPRYAGRVILTPVEGQLNPYDLVRADDPTQQGTPLNTSNLLSGQASATILTLAGVEPTNLSEAFLQLSKVLYPLKKNAVGILSGSYIGTGYSYAAGHSSGGITIYGALTAPLLSLEMTFTPLVIVISKASRGINTGVAVIPYTVSSAGGSLNTTVTSNNYGINLDWQEYGLNITHTTYKSSSTATPPATEYNSGMNDSGVTYYYTVIGIVPDTGVVDEDEIDWEAAVLALIDDTLTLASHAADAKATGDAIAALSARMDTIVGSDLLKAFPTDTASGEVASFSDGADDLPVKQLLASISPVQPGSGDPSASNVRPISGFTGLTLSHSGADTSDADTAAFDWESAAGTVYAGTLDVTTGLLTVTYRMQEFRGDNLTNAAVDSVRINVSSMGKGSYTLRTHMISDQYKQVTTASTQPLAMRMSSDGNQLYLYDTARFTSAEVARSVLNETPVHVLYPLAAPKTYQLTPAEVRTVLGENRIWTDVGDVTAEYRADPTMYINKKIAEALTTV